MASISPLKAEIRNSLVTREKDGGKGRRLVLEHVVIHLSKLLSPHQMKGREATIGKQVDIQQGHNNHLSTTFFHFTSNTKLKRDDVTPHF